MGNRVSPRWLMVVLGWVVLVAPAVASGAGKFKVARCKTDNDCTGTKICVKGTCEEPGGASGSAAGACNTDKDCPGNQVCSQSKCAEPGGAPPAAAPAAAAPAAAAPPPAPTAAPAAAPPPAPASCAADKDCPGNQVCSQNRCVDSGAPQPQAGYAAQAQPGYAAQPQPYAAQPGQPAAAGPEAPSAVGHGGSVAGLLGYGLSGDSDVQYKIGVGVRGGYTLPFNLYIGGSLVYHLGKSEGGYSQHLWYVASEVGYALAAGPMEIRPYAGIGMASVSYSSPAYSDSNSRIILYPGVTAIFPFGKGFVGADTRYVIMTDVEGPGTGNSIGMFFTGGMRF